jgi:hypothetical protein
MLETDGTIVDQTPDVRHLPGDSQAIPTREQLSRAYKSNLRERQKGRGERLRTFLLSVRDRLRSVDRETRIKHLMDIDQMFRYYQGDQYGHYGPDGTYYPYTIQEGDYAYTVPVIKGHVEQAFAQILKTRTEYEFRAKKGPDGDAKALARMCETIASEERKRLMTEDNQQTEILNTILAGESYRLLYWGPGTKKVKRMSYGPASADGREVENLNGQERERTLGQNCLLIPQPMAVKRSLEYTSLDASPFIVVHDYLPKQVAEWRYQAPIPDSAGLSDEVRLMMERERATAQADAIVGSANSSWLSSYMSGRSVGREKLWLDPSEYGAFYLDQDETTPSGKTLRAGKLLGDYYPDGLYVKIVGDLVMEMRPRRKSRQWSVVLYGRRPGSCKGAGLQALISLQDIVNDTFNLDYMILMTYKPLTILDRKMVKELAPVGNMLLVNSPDRPVADGVAQFPGQAPSGAIGATSERINNAMQFIEGTYTPFDSGGAPDQRAASTATGVNMMVEQQYGRMVGPIGQRIGADKELMYQILENIKEHSAPEQREELAKRFGPQTAEAFFECDFRSEMEIDVVSGTDQPRSQARTQANMIAFAQFASSFATPDAPPWALELLSHAAEVLSIPFQIAPGHADREEAEYRLGKLVSMEEKLRKDKPDLLETRPEEAGALMYEMLEKWCGPLVKPPPEGQEKATTVYTFLQEHQTFMDVYRDWLFDMQSKTSSQALRMVVIQMWNDHYLATLRAELLLAELKRDMQAAMQPQEPPGPTPEESAAQEQQGREQGMQEEAMMRLADEEQKDADLQRQEAHEEANLRRQLAVESHKAALNSGEQDVGVAG